MAPGRGVREYRREQVCYRRWMNTGRCSTNPRAGEAEIAAGTLLPPLSKRPTSGADHADKLGSYGATEAGI